MNPSITVLPDSVYNIYGFLSPSEMTLLHRLASEVPAGGRIVEIGSFQGKSTVCLGLGAKQSGAKVWAIDPHDDYQVNAETHYGMENHAALLKNLVEFGVADVVRVVALPSCEALYAWRKKAVSIDLLWIDGSHEYEDVLWDFGYWMYEVAGRIVMHDTSGHFPGVSRVLNEVALEKGWKIAEQVDATTVLEKVGFTE